MQPRGERATGTRPGDGGARAALVAVEAEGRTATLRFAEGALPEVEQFVRDDRPSTHKDWPALLRLLERRGIDYVG